jgi:hypothetical protein
MVWHDHGALTYYINIPKELECIVKLGKGNCMSNIKLVLKKGYQRGYQELPINECEPYIRQAEQQGIIYIANNIMRFLQTPEAEMIKAYWTLVRKGYRFDNCTRWYEWNRICNVWERNEMRHYTLHKIIGIL